MTQPLVLDVAECRRFEIHVRGTLAGYVDYHLEPGRITFTHTTIDDAYAGQGLGSLLARNALDAAHESRLAVYPQCPFIRSWIAKHPDYVDLVAAPERERSGL